MKRLLALLVVATLLASVFAMTPVISANTAELIVNSAEGTAVIDGVKDDAYSAATELKFNQCGKDNGGGAVLDTPKALGYIINDADGVYVFISVADTDIDNSSVNNYEQDSVEVFFMADNAKTQWRIHYDGTVDADSGLPATLGTEFATAMTDTGYDVEVKVPITDVLDNQIQMVLQINSAAEGKREATVHIEGHTDGDLAYQRNTRQDTAYDGWWTLQLAGEFENTRVDPVEEPAELTIKNYKELRDAQVFVQAYTQDKVSWGWHGVGSGSACTLGNSVTPEGITNLFPPVYEYTAEETADWTSLPIFAVQIGDNGYLEPSIKNDDGSYKDSGTVGDSARYKFTYSDITVKANGYNDVVVPGGEIVTKWTAKSEGSYTSGTASTIDLIGPASEQLGLDIQGACTWLANVTDINVTVNYDQIELLTLDDINAFETSLAELEQTFIDESLAEYTTRVNTALETAKKEGVTVEELEAALDDAQKAANRARKDSENAGYIDGAAYAYCDTLQASVDEIQGIYDAAVAAAAPEEPAPEEAPSEDTAPAEESGSSSSEGGNTGLIIGIVVVVVIVIVAVVGVVLSKKKK